MKPRLFALSLALAASPGAALDLTFPYPVTGQDGAAEALATYGLPTGPWDGASVPLRPVEGPVDRRAVRLDAGRATLLQVLAPLRDQVTAAGYRVLLDCEARVCGGFDFRFAIDILPEPMMHVDLGDYRFLSAERGGEALSLLVSRSDAEVFVQVIRAGGPLAPVAEGLPEVPVAAVEGLAAGLDAGLSVPLDDLVFAPGQAELAPGDYASLALLADWLAGDPGRRLALVGHTDVTGALAANLALSRARAEAARAALLSRHAVPADRVSADGIGPYAPRAPNATEEGRQKNRRVEAVATSTRGGP
jgi:outer membrane protein OmpA-like peptidoglycan-associated protein